MSDDEIINGIDEFLNNHKDDQYEGINGNEYFIIDTLADRFIEYKNIIDNVLNIKEKLEIVEKWRKIRNE